jgi:hypothetical protein
LEEVSEGLNRLSIGKVRSQVSLVWFLQTAATGTYGGLQIEIFKNYGTSSIIALIAGTKPCTLQTTGILCLLYAEDVEDRSISKPSCTRVLVLLETEFGTDLVEQVAVTNSRFLGGSFRSQDVSVETIRGFGQDDSQLQDPRSLGDGELPVDQLHHDLRGSVSILQTDWTMCENVDFETLALLEESMCARDSAMPTDADVDAISRREAVRRREKESVLQPQYRRDSNPDDDIDRMQSQGGRCHSSTPEAKGLFRWKNNHDGTNDESVTNSSENIVVVTLNYKSSTVSSHESQEAMSKPGLKVDSGSTEGGCSHTYRHRRQLGCWVDDEHNITDHSHGRAFIVDLDVGDSQHASARRDKDVEVSAYRQRGSTCVENPRVIVLTVQEDWCGPVTFEVKELFEPKHNLDMENQSELCCGYDSLNATEVSRLNIDRDSTDHYESLRRHHLRRRQWVGDQCGIACALPVEKDMKIVDDRKIEAASENCGITVMILIKHESVPLGGSRSQCAAANPDQAPCWNNFEVYSSDAPYLVRAERGAPVRADHRFQAAGRGREPRIYFDYNSIDCCSDTCRRRPRRGRLALPHRQDFSEHCDDYLLRRSGARAC